jgi:hypothetical protein
LQTRSDWGIKQDPIFLQVSPGNKVRPYLKNNQCEKSWQSDSNGRAPAQQVSGPDVSP